MSDPLTRAACAYALYGCPFDDLSGRPRRMVDYIVRYITDIYVQGDRPYAEAFASEIEAIAEAFPMARMVPVAEPKGIDKSTEDAKESLISEYVPPEARMDGVIREHLDPSLRQEPPVRVHRCHERAELLRRFQREGGAPVEAITRILSIDGVWLAVSVSLSEATAVPILFCPWCALRLGPESGEEETQAGLDRNVLETIRGSTG